MEKFWRRVSTLVPGLVLVSVLAGLLAAGTVARFSSGWAVHFSYVVSLKEREPSTTYRFDGYYALQAVELFTKTLAEWAVAPEVAAQAYRAAGLPEPTGVLKLVEAEAAAPQLVRVTVRARERAQAERLAAGLQAALAAQLTHLETASVPAVHFEATATEPWVAAAGFNKNIVGVATGVLVFFMGLNLIVLRESLRYGHRD